MSNTKTVKDSAIVTDGKCKLTGKTAYREKVAIRRSGRWKPDERGSWSAYQCKYEPTHWHVGHSTGLPQQRAKDSKQSPRYSDNATTEANHKGADK